MRSLNWELLFEIIYDDIDTTVGEVRGKRKYKMFHSIYHVIKELDATQSNYTVTKKEMLALALAFDMFRSYLVGTNIVVYIDHAAI